MTEPNNQINKLEPIKADSIKLDTTSGITRWLEYKISTYNNSKEVFILIMTLLTAFIGGPALVFFGMSWILAGSSGTSGNGAEALAFNNILYLILLGLTIIFTWIILHKICTPTHLLITPNGLQYQYRNLFGYKGKSMPWKNISSLIIYKPKNKVNHASYQLAFINGTKQVFNVPVGWLHSPQNKENLLGALDQYLPEVPRDYEVPFYLQPPSAQSYTDIWFQSFRTAPKFDMSVRQLDISIKHFDP